jgi:predicted AlkP superfamily phosphohydrolase/phosphomutase
MNRKRTLVIGLDGATFDLLGPWIQRGLLANLQKIKEKGVCCELATVFPPVTPAAWTSFMTGKNPGKHGVFDFLYRKDGTYDMAPCNGDVIDGAAVWEELGRAGKKVIVINVPMTYPPREVNGSLVTGLDTPRSRPPHLTNYTFPPELRDEIRGWVGDYIIHPREIYRRGRVDKLLKELHASLEKRAEVVKRLMRRTPWDFCMVVFSETDKIQHDLWHLMDETHPLHDREESERYKGEFVDFFRAVDSKVGMLMEEAGQETSVFIISDHGQGPIYKWIYLNNWLIHMGFMRLKSDPVSLLKRLSFAAGLTPSNIYNFLTHLGFSKARVSQGDRYRLISRFFLSVNNIDWTRTVAYSAGHVGQVYINLEGREPKGIVKPGREYKEVRERIKDALLSWRDPENGQAVVEDVYYKEELYTGKYMDRAADILFMPTRLEYWTLGVSSFISNRIMGPAFGNSSNHRMNGILMAMGPHIRPGVEVQGANIMDVAPTILYDQGIAIRRDMDGKVLTEIFLDEFLRENPVRITDYAPSTGPKAPSYSEEEEREILDRLKDLGYLG